MNKEEKIKVGQWARHKRKIWIDDDYEDYIYGISKIKEYDPNVKFGGWVTFEDGGERYGNNIIKTADKLEDLLGVGDIVSLYDTRLKTIYKVVIENELRLHSIVELINEGLYKITAIELYENRVKQKIGGDGV